MKIPKYNPNFLPEGYKKDAQGLIAPLAYFDLTEDEKEEICNGIGARHGISKLMPNTIWFLDVTEAGNIHDYGYDIGGVQKDKEITDEVFLHNLRVLIFSACRLLRSIREKRAIKYYIAVSQFGKSHFNFVK